MDPTADEYSLERMRDRMQIQDLLYRLVRAVDRRDYDAVRDAFHPDGVDDHGAYSGGFEGYIEFSRKRNETIPSSMHQLSNILVEFASLDLALVETYVWSVQQYPAAARAALSQFVGNNAPEAAHGVDSLGCARYVDRIERREGRWRIRHRTVLMDWKAMLPLQAPPAAFPMFKPSSRNQEDWLYRERRALGIGT
ncbi:MAG: hypothetical protein JWQ76_5257 [Ramlibacter sp.]|nr:hypothetical protein [Ramlibacter sp.]